MTERFTVLSLIMQSSHRSFLIFIFYRETPAEPVEKTEGSDKIEPAETKVEVGSVEGSVGSNSLEDRADVSPLLLQYFYDSDEYFIMINWICRPGPRMKV